MREGLTGCGAQAAFTGTFTYQRSPHSMAMLLKRIEQLNEWRATLRIVLATSTSGEALSEESCVYARSTRTIGSPTETVFSFLASNSFRSLDLNDNHRMYVRQARLIKMPVEIEKVWSMKLLRQYVADAHREMHVSHNRRTKTEGGVPLPPIPVRTPLSSPKRYPSLFYR